MEPLDWRPIPKDNAPVLPGLAGGDRCCRVEHTGRSWAAGATGTVRRDSRPGGSAANLSAQTFLAAASVWGQHAPVSTIVSVAQLSGGRVEVDAAVAAGLLTETESLSELTFTHPLYRAAIYARSQSHDARELHERAAEHVVGRAQIVPSRRRVVGCDDVAGRTNSRRRLCIARQPGTLALRLGPWNRRLCCLSTRRTGAAVTRRRRGPSRSRRCIGGGASSGDMPKRQCPTRRLDRTSGSTSRIADRGESLAGRLAGPRSGDSSRKSEPGRRHP